MELTIIVAIAAFLIVTLLLVVKKYSKWISERSTDSC